MKNILLGVLLTSACGGSNGGTPGVDGPPGGFVDAPTNPSMRYEPWTVGSTWSYMITDTQGLIPPAMNKVTRIMPMVDAGPPNAGKMAFLVHVEKLQGYKDVLETFSGDLDVRYKTSYYDLNNALTEVDVNQPYRLKLDEGLAHVAPGAHYSETFTETVTKTGTAPTTKQQSENWTVVSASESLAVIAGTFTCLHVQRVNPAKPTAVIDYWYARGVGKVKETGGSTDEELMAYTIAP